MAKDAESIIKGEVEEVLALSRSLTDSEQELMQDERFKRFLELQKNVTAQVSEAWQKIEKEMIDNDVKSIKGDWGSLTIAERLSWDYDASMLPPKFFKKVVDTKKLSDVFRLEGKAPPAAFPRYTKYLTRRIK